MPLVIYPYLMLDSIWVFDDERTGLKEEAFVGGMSEMISRLTEVKGVPSTGKGFAMTFSDEPFAGANAILNWLRSDDPDDPMPGNWYSGLIASEMMEGWLCPALLLYFKRPPAKLYVQVAPLAKGVDPIWHDHDGRGRRYLGPES